MIKDLLKYKTSNRIYVLGSGRSVLDITPEEWSEINKHDSIGFNHWYVHEHKPTFYDLSYLANDYFPEKESDMFYLACKNCPDSKFILNHELDDRHLELFEDKVYAKTYVNHFDLFEGDLDSISLTNDDKVGTLAEYWDVRIFSIFNQPYGELLPNDYFINKSRGQLFATIQIAVLLGYTDIRLIGVDLNDENKFQDYYSDAPYSSKSIGHGGEKFQPRVDVSNNTIDPSGIHNTCQGTKDRDYLGIHKLITIFRDKCLSRIGTSLTVCNDKSLLVKENIKYQNIIGDLNMDKITFCIPSKSNLRYLKSCVKSIRDNAYRKDHDIIVFVDSDEDGTVDWLKENADKYDISYYINPDLGNSLYGIGRAYDFCIQKSKTDLVMIFHADMILGRDADYHVYRYSEPKKVVCSTRIEPPLHPNAGEKILEDFGMWPEEFKSDDFNKFVADQTETKTTEGIFAPWLIHKSDLLELGGHDPIMHSCREDSDLFNRFILAGYKLVQSWQFMVYHFTGRGAGSFSGDEERHEKWKIDMMNSTKEFIRKWGSNVRHDNYMKPIIAPKYDIGVVVKNCNYSLIEMLEPWCSTMYVDGDSIKQYIDIEQKNTDYKLSDRVKTFDSAKNNDICVYIDGTTFNQQDFNIIQMLPDVIKDSGDIGKFELGNISMHIQSMSEYQNNLIVCEY